MAWRKAKPDQSANSRAGEAAKSGVERRFEQGSHVPCQRRSLSGSLQREKLYTTFTSGKATVEPPSVGTTNARSAEKRSPSHRTPPVTRCSPPTITTAAPFLRL